MRTGALHLSHMIMILEAGMEASFSMIPPDCCGPRGFDSFNDHGILSRIHTKHFPRLAPLLAGDHHDTVIFSNLHEQLSKSV
jgi:hypothetical protein